MSFPFTCCQREDPEAESYFHPCGCPVGLAVTQSRSKTATMCGILQDVPDPVDPVVFPIAAGTWYKNSLYTYGGVYFGEHTYTNTYSIDEEGNCVPSQSSNNDYCLPHRGHLNPDDGLYYAVMTTTTTRTGTASGTITYDEWPDSPQTGSFNTETIETSTMDTDFSGFCNKTATETSTGTSSYEVRVKDYEGPYSGEVMESCSGTYLNGVWTSTRNGNPYAFACMSPDTVEETIVYSGVTATDHGDAVTTYTSPDTDAAAEGRADFSEWASGGSSAYIETREGDSSSFGVAELKYFFLFTGLAIGVSYVGASKSEVSDAGSVTERSWTPSTEVDHSFTATKPYELIGGTLNVSEEDFIENNYSLDPDTYDLEDGDLVVTPAYTLGVTSGTARRIGTTYIEKA